MNRRYAAKCDLDAIKEAKPHSITVLPVKQAQGQRKPYFKNNYHDKPEGDTKDKKPTKKYEPYVPEENDTNDSREALNALYGGNNAPSEPIHAPGVKYVLLHADAEGESVYLERANNIVFCT